MSPCALALVFMATPLPAATGVPAAIVENPGHLPALVSHFQKGRGHAIFFTRHGPILSLGRADGTGERVTLTLSLEGLAESVTVEPARELPGKVNVFVSDDPARWRTGLTTHGELWYRDAWPGIDVSFRPTATELKYEFHVAPGAHPDAIRLAYRGALGLRIEERRLLVETGEATLVDAAPQAYQTVGGRRVPVPVDYRLHPGSDTAPAFGFDLPRGHDTGSPLVIDPGIQFATFLGGSGSDDPWAVAVDGSGAIYVSGTTGSVDFPVSGGAPDPALTDSVDAFVAKLDATGSTLLWATYLGGSDDEVAFVRTAVNASGDSFVTGTTRSTDFPTTPGSFQDSAPPHSHPVRNDTFVTSLDPDGLLRYSTYLAGGDWEQSGDVRADAAGNAWVCGRTLSINFPTTAGALDNGRSGSSDAYVAKLDPTGANLIYATYLGGSGSEYAVAMDVDGAGNAHVTGLTGSADFPTTPGGYYPTQPVADLSNREGTFTAVIDPTGSFLVYSTYGGDDDIAVDDQGMTYLVGGAAAGRPSPFPATSGAFDVSSGGSWLAKLDASQPGTSSLVFATYLDNPSAGSGFAHAVDTDLSGSAHVAFATPAGARVVRVSPSGGSAVASTALGSGVTSRDIAVRPGACGLAVLTGQTTATGITPTVGAHDTSFNGGGTDGFVLGLDSSFDLNQNGADDYCESWDNHGDYVSSVAHACQLYGPPPGFKNCGQAVSAAAKSDVGKG